MTAIFTGLGAGFERGSGSVIGSGGLLGSSILGRGGEQLFLNAATGNFMVSQRDEFLIGLGLDASVSRTYNSLGDLSDENQDNWRQGTDRRIYGLTGAINTVGSTVKRVSADGSEITYTHNGSAYVATDGAGAYDKLAFNAATNEWTWTDGDTQVTETYAANGVHWLITKQTDPDGNSLTWSYLADGKLYRVTTQDGSYVQYNWSGNNVSEIITGYTDLATSTSKTLTRTRYTYDQNRLSSVTVDLSPDDGSIADGKTYTTNYTYKSNTVGDAGFKLVASISQTDGSHIAITYDASNRVSTLVQTSATGVTRASSLAYGAGYTNVTDPLGNVARLDYNADGSLKKITLPPAAISGPAQVVEFAYNGNGDLTSVTDALTNATSFAYDSNGNVISTTDRLGNVTTRTYGAKNELLTETTTSSDAASSAAAHTVRYAYDSENHLRYRVSAEGHVTEYRYTAAGQLEYSIDYPEQFYDVSALGPTAALTDVQLNSWRDAIADKSSVQITVNTYDVRGNLVTSESFSSATTAGVPTTGGAGTTTTSSGNLASDLNSSQWAAQTSTVKSSTTVNGQPATQITSYNRSGEPDEPGTTGYVSNSQTLAAGETLTFEIDLYGSSSSIATIGFASAPGSAFFGDAAMTVVSGPGTIVQNPDGSWKVSGLSAGTATRVRLSRTFSAAGAGTTIVYPGNKSAQAFGASVILAIASVVKSSVVTTAGESTSKTYFTYDQAGRLLARNVQGRAVETFVYDGLGRMVSAVDVNGGTSSFVFNDAASKTIVTFASGLIQTSTYNKAGELVDFTESTAAGGLTASTGTALYGYDQLGRLRWQIDATNRKTYFVYDRIGRKALDISSQGDVIEYRYDANNRLVATIAHGNRYLGTFTSLDDANAPVDPASFIPNSSTSDLWSWNLYGKEGRLIQSIAGDGSSSVMTYDGAGRLIRTVSHASRFTSAQLAELHTATPDSLAGRILDPSQWSSVGLAITQSSINGTRAELLTVQQSGVIGYTETSTTVPAGNFVTFEVTLLASGPKNYARVGLYALTSEWGDPSLSSATIISGPGSVVRDPGSLFVVGGLSTTIPTRILITRKVTQTEQVKAVIFAGESGSTAATAGDQVIVANRVLIAANDQVSRIFYDKDGRLLGTLNGEGFVTQTIYDKAGRKIEVKAFLNATTADRVNSTFNQLVAGVIAHADDRRTRYVYDGQGQLRFVIDAKFQVTETLYDSAGQATTAIAYSAAISSSTTNFSYANIKTLAAALTVGRRSWSVYDSAGRVAYAINAENGVTAFSYNSSGQVTKVVEFATARSTTSLPTKATMDTWTTSNIANAANRITRNFYDKSGVLRYSVDGEGFISRVDVDAEGRVTKTLRWANAIAATDSSTTDTVHTAVTSGGGTTVEITNVYDTLGRLQTSTDGEGVIRRYEYNANGLLAKDIAAWGAVDESTTYAVYDAAGRLIEQHRGYGVAEVAVTKFAYDGLGNVISTTDPNNKVTTQTFDRLGQVLTRTNALSGVTSFQYDAFGNVVKVTDVRGNASYNYYDNLNRLIFSRDAEGYLTQTVHTPFGQVDQVIRRVNKANNTAAVGTLPTVTIDAKDAVTRFEYDKLGRVTKTTDAEGHYEQYTLNAFGNRTSVRNKLGANIINSFDRRGLLITETLPMSSVRNDGTVQATSIINKFEYDSRGNRTRMNEAYGLIGVQRTTTYAYDKLNRLITKAGDALSVLSQGDHLSLSTVTPTESYLYDRRGNLIQVTDSLGGRAVSYYDDLNRKIAEVGSMGSFSRWTYDAAGNVLSERRYATKWTGAVTTAAPPSVATHADDRVTNYTYDALNRLWTTSVAGVLVGSWNGSGVSPATQTVTTTLTYDAAGNLIVTQDASGGWVWSWYDKLGRKTEQLDQERYLTKWTYDAEGNVLSETRYATKWTQSVTSTSAPKVTSSTDDRVTTFTYDKTGHRLTETRTGVVTWSVNTTNGAVTQTGTNATIIYTYNGLGQVTRKTEATGDRVNYTYDGTGRLITESRSAYADQASATVTPTVTYSYDGINNLSRTQQGGAVLNASTDRVTRYTYGAGGRLASMTDAAGGVHNYAYDAAGNLLRDSYTRLKSDGITTVNEGILYTRDILGRVTAQAIANNNGTAWVRGDSQNSEYNAYGEVSRRGLNGLWQESFTYDNAGRLIKNNSGDGVWRFFIYDANGNRTLTIESEGTDLSGLTQADALNLARPGGVAAGSAFVDGINLGITIYDKRSMAVQSRLPQRELAAGGTRESLITSQTYNAFGEVKSQTDALNNTTSFAYNTMGRLTQKVLPAVNVTSTTGAISTVNPTENYLYDVSGRLVATQDANGNIVSRTLLAGTGYGGTEALVTDEYHADGGIFETYYDVFGDARILENELNVRETRVYDAMGRLTTQTLRTGLAENYVYDLLGQRTAHWNSFYGSTVVETTDYDLQGRVVSTKDYAGDRTNHTYAWDATITTALGTSGGWTQTTTQWAQLGSTLSKQKSETTSLHGLTTREVDFAGNTIDYTYDKAGRLTQKVGTIYVAGTTEPPPPPPEEPPPSEPPPSEPPPPYEPPPEDPPWRPGDPQPYSEPVSESSTLTASESSTSSGTPSIVTTLSYSHFNTGLTATIADSSWGMTANAINSTFAYDAMGRRTRETYAGTVYKSYSDGSYTTLISSSQTLQDATITYDALGRLTSFNSSGSSGSVSVNQSYDAAGNIRRAQTTYPAVVTSGSASSDKWFTYDAMNRMVIANGALVGAAISTTNIAGAVTVSYDVAGNRKIAATERTEWMTIDDGQTWEEFTVTDTEAYNYDADNQLSSVVKNGLTISTTSRDLLGRVTDYVERSGTKLANHRFSIVYNARGQVTSERGYQWIDGAKDIESTVTNQYDSYGNLTRTTNVLVDLKDTWQSWTYAWKDQAVVASSTYDKELYDSNNNLYRSDQYYDALGRLQRTFIADGKPRAVHFALTPDEQILSRVQNNESSDDPRDYRLFASGRQVAEYTNNSKEDVRNYDYQALIATKTSNASGSGDFYQGATAGTSGGEFGTSGYDPTNPITAGTGRSSRSSYTVQAGDTLDGIASRIWGDSSLWYKLAEANGLSADSMLTAGQALSLPLQGPASRNNADMFRPYDTASAVGDLNPTAAKPPKKKSGGLFGKILLAVIAIAVVVITSGAAIAALAPVGAGVGGAGITGIGSAMAALGAGMTGLSTATLVGIGAAAGALGSIVSQGVGVAAGIQDKFSWKGVAMSALAGGISAGMGPGGIFGQTGAFGGVSSPFVQGALRGAASSAATQGVAVATGLQKKFDWAGVAAAGVSGGVSSALTKSFKLGPLGVDNSIGNHLAYTGVGMAASIANAATRSLIQGTNFGDNVLAGLPDVIGQTVGNILENGLSRTSASAAADQIVDDIATARERSLNGPLTKKDRIELRNLEREITASIREARRLEATDPGSASAIQKRVIERTLAEYPAAEANAARQILAGSRPLAAAEPTNLGDEEIIVTGTLPEQPYGHAYGLFDRPAVQAGRIKAKVEGEIDAWVERTPGARTALTVVKWGMAIAGGAPRFLAGSAYGAIQGKAEQAATQKFQSAGFSKVTSEHGGSGLPWLVGIALGTVSLGAAKLGFGRREGSQSFSQLQLDAARSWGVHPKWINSEGRIRWPGNDGFAPGVTIRELQPGTMFDRYGGTGGHFASPQGVPFSERSLPNSSLDGPFAAYEVVRPLPGVVSGKAAPWFDQPGGGMQYKLPMSIEYLIKNGFIRPR